MNKWRRLTCARNSSVHLSLKHLLKHLSHKIKVTHLKSLQIPLITHVRTCYMFRLYSIFQASKGKSKGKGKGKVVPFHDMKAYRGSRSIFPLILNFGNR